MNSLRLINDLAVGKEVKLETDNNKYNAYLDSYRIDTTNGRPKIELTLYGDIESGNSQCFGSIPKMVPVYMDSGLVDFLKEDPALTEAKRLSSQNLITSYETYNQIKDLMKEMPGKQTKDYGHVPSFPATTFDIMSPAPEMGHLAPNNTSAYNVDEDVEQDDEYED